MFIREGTVQIVFNAKNHSALAGPITKLEREFLQELTVRPYVAVQGMIDRLLNGIEEAFPEAICSILKLSPDDTLLHYSAPHLPKEYTKLINGCRPGPNAGSCGTAVYYDKVIIVADTFSDPLWKDYAGIARAFGLGSCWSVPIHYSNGDILGTFADRRSRDRVFLRGERGGGQALWLQFPGVFANVGL